jgi:hypothetical protein
MPGLPSTASSRTNQLAIDDRAIHLDGGSGVIGGGQVGYNHQLTPTIVVGVEADIQGADIQKSKSFSRSTSSPARPLFSRSRKSQANVSAIVR